MNEKKRLAGRFLPSRVYARWKWTVRFGLAALPLILFLTGSVVLYFTPGRYRSTVVFEYLGKRTPVEAVALLKSRAVISEAIHDLKATERLEVDSDTAADIISRDITTKVDSSTGMIELQTENTQSEFARDLADALPKALDSYEKSRATAGIKARIEAAEKSVTDAGDAADEKRQALVRLISVRGPQAADPISQLDLDAARGEWDHAHRRTLEAQDRVTDAERELSSLGSSVAIHSQPVISHEPLGKKADESLAAVVLRALLSGLAFALGVPYLLELAYPRRVRSISPAKEIWSDEPGFAEFPANG